MAPGDGGQVLQQDRGQPAALVLVGHGEGHLGLVLAGPPVVAGVGDELVAEQCDQRDAVHHVDGGEALDLGLGQAGLGREEPVVQRLGGQPAVEAAERLGIRRPDGPHVHRAAVGEDHIGLPLSIRGREGHGRSR